MTGNELFEFALDLCGLRTADGNPASDTADLLQRSVTLINILLAENAALDGAIRKSEHTVNTIETLDDTIPVTDIVASAVLPYGLARLMLLGEDDSAAADFNALYEKARSEAMRFGKPAVHEIREVYT